LDVDPGLMSGRELCEGLLERGVLAKDTHGSTIRLAPPLVATEEEIDILLDALRDTLDEAQSSA
jgi:ornithine--oxo-acid transaminase